MASTVDHPLTLAGRTLSNKTGFGLMGMTWRAQPPSTSQSFATLRQALSSGSNFWNAGEIYGTSTRNSLHLLHEYFSQHPSDADRVVISVKGGFLPDTMTPDGSRANTHRSINECLARLQGTKRLDIWESARVDPQTPIEITMRAAQEFVDDGRLGGVALSECSAATIRRASRVVRVVAVEVEVSLWATEIFHNGVAETCAELAIPVVAYSPLGRGFLTGQVKSRDDLPEDDMRRHLPRFSEENFGKNLALVDGLERLARRKGVTAGQVALGWVRAQSGRRGNPVIIPIPGSTTPERVKENLVEVELDESDLKEIDELMAKVQISGGRYPEHGSALLFGDTPALTE